MARARLPDAVVVGAGPNGLAAAIALAQAGRSVRVLEAEPTVGGGSRSAELTLPGFVHDICSAIHPHPLASPFLRKLPLDRHGLEITESRTFHLEYGPVGWLQSALNRVGPRRNFLYELVKDRGALASLSKKEMIVALLTSTAVGGALAPASLAAELAAGASGAGAVLTAVTRRKRGAA